MADRAAMLWREGDDGQAHVYPANEDPPCGASIRRAAPNPGDLPRCPVCLPEAHRRRRAEGTDQTSIKGRP